MSDTLSSEKCCNAHAATAPDGTLAEECSKPDASPSSEPKFCKDCKWFKEAGAVAFPFGGSFSWPDSCSQPPDRDLIHGRKTPVSPNRMRSEQGACKPQALLWEAK